MCVTGRAFTFVEDWTVLLSNDAAAPRWVRCRSSPLTVFTLTLVDCGGSGGLPISGDERQGSWDRGMLERRRVYDSSSRWGLALVGASCEGGMMSRPFRPLRPLRSPRWFTASRHPTLTLSLAFPYLGGLW